MFRQVVEMCGEPRKIQVGFTPSSETKTNGLRHGSSTQDGMVRHLRDLGLVSGAVALLTSLAYARRH